MGFGVDLAAFAAKAKANADAVVRKVVLDIGAELVQMSPVGDASYWLSPPPPGYTGGRFRGNWQHGIATPPVGEIDAVDPSGGATLAKIAGNIPANSGGLVHYIMNNLPYAHRLEDGYSRQAPHGMVGLTVIKFQGIVDAAAQAVNK